MSLKKSKQEKFRNFKMGVEIYVVGSSFFTVIHSFLFLSDVLAGNFFATFAYQPGKGNDYIILGSVVSEWINPEPKPPLTQASLFHCCHSWGNGKVKKIWQLCRKKEKFKSRKLYFI